MLKQFNLEDRTALVTGGSQGIGKSIAFALAEAGATVMIAARNEKKLIEAQAELSAATKGKILYTTVDLANRQSTQTLIEHCLAKLGNVDIVVANAAPQGDPQLIVDIDDQRFDHITEVILHSTMALTRGFAPAMKAQQWGRFIYISSVSAYRGSARGISVYSATKAALHAFARVGAVELGRDGITVNCIAPGLILTERAIEIVKTGTGAVASVHSSMTAVGRGGMMEELQGAVLLLASEAGRYMTGSEVVVDGGMSIRMFPST